MKTPAHVHPASEKITSGTNETFWINSTGPLAFSRLTQHTETDVVIVGGGIAGINTAYALLRSGKKVVLVEDGFIGSGETGRTSAHLVNALDDRYYELEHMFGEKKTALIAESHSKAIDFIEQAVRTEHIDCNFKRVDGYLFLHHSDKEENLDKELEAATKAGVEVEKVNFIPGMSNFRGNGLRFKNQAQFHPMKYLKGLCEAIRQKGGEIYTNTRAKTIDHTGIVTESGFRINARHVVVATNTPVNNHVVMHLKQYPYRTYILAARIQKDSLPDQLWWDTGDFDVNKDIPPYHYVRKEKLDDQYDLLIIGGEDHPTGLADMDGVPEQNRYTALENWAKKYFDFEDIAYRWSGQVLEPMDGLAFIGRNPMDKDNVYIITGDSGNGLTHSAVGAMLITDLINNRENPWEDVYDPSRFKLFKAGGVFLRELASGMKNYLVAKKEDGEESDLGEIRPNEGKVVKLEGKPYGVFCDEAKQLHIVGAECTHMKCIIRWNNDEKSWDCPCHGSRFSYEGKVLNGPANADLSYHQQGRVPGEGQNPGGTVFGDTKETKTQ